MSFDKINAIATLILSVAAVIVGVRSCQIGADVANDKKQIDTLANIARTDSTALQQIIRQTGVLSNELQEMKTQSALISNEYSEMKNVDKGIADQTGKISKQLGFTQKQQKEKVHEDTLLAKRELLSMRKEIDEMQSNHPGLLDIINNNSFQIRLDYVKEIASFLDKPYNYQVFLENDSMVFHWNAFYVRAKSLANEYSRLALDSNVYYFQCTIENDVPQLSPTGTLQLKRRARDIADCMSRFRKKDLSNLNQLFFTFHVDFSTFIEYQLRPFVDEKCIQYGIKQL